ncbi:MAG: O-antigen ligase family protein [Oculatellaceae cyanobacterium Prado106]|jgi:hypothetical protein|nr:O-antigen ligase family protein [Oculatellaceae cyanobacterium Prado106]
MVRPNKDSFPNVSDSTLNHSSKNHTSQSSKTFTKNLSKNLTSYISQVSEKRRSQEREQAREMDTRLSWGAVVLFVVFSALLLQGSPSLLRVAFPGSAFVVALFLYFKSPLLYTGFTWWIWFLTPWVRRMIDYNLGVYDEQPVVLLTPFLVTFVSILTFIRHLPNSSRTGGLPFVIAILALVYSFLVGAIQNSPITVIRAFLDWFTPVLFSFHLFCNWRDYPNYRQNFQRIFIWGLILLGGYGIYQYMIAPGWDQFWMEGSQLLTIGRPEPFQIRLFGTMNSPGPYAIVMMAGLLLLLSVRGVLKFPAAGLGMLSFLLALVRSAWLGWMVGFVTLSLSLRPKLQIKLLTTLFVMLILIAPLATLEPFSGAIQDRAESLVRIADDRSLRDRTNIYDSNFAIALSDPLGKGMGGTYFITSSGKPEAIVFDSGLLVTFFTLGWLGAIPYLGSLMMLLYNLFQSEEVRFDAFAGAALAIGLGTFVQIGLGSSMLGVAGMVLWSFVGIGMAARKYYAKNPDLKP